MLGMALDGLAALTDPELRAVFQGNAADATWSWPRQAADRTTVDHLTRRLVLGEDPSD